MQEKSTKELKFTDDIVIEQPSVTVDIVIFTILNNELKVLMIKRKTDPFKDSWAIPGGFIHVGETLDQAALRALYEKTGVNDVYLEQLYTFGLPERDPRKRVITVSYYSLVGANKLPEKFKEGVEDLDWFSIVDLPLLAFDHCSIIEAARERIAYKVGSSDIGFQFLPEEFTLTEIQNVYEIILGKKLDKRNFRKRILASHMLQNTNRTKMDGYHRPAKLYTCKKH